MNDDFSSSDFINVDQYFRIKQNQKAIIDSNFSYQESLKEAIRSKLFLDI